MNKIEIKICRSQRFFSSKLLTDKIVIIKFILLLLFNFGTIITLFGQASKFDKNNIQISLGANYDKLIDEAFTNSKLNFSGTSFIMGLFYQRKTNKYILKTTIHGSKGKVVSNNILKADLYSWQLATSLALKTKTFSAFGITNELYLGTQVSVYDYFLSEMEIIENATFLFNNIIGFYLYNNISINKKNKIELELVLPFAGFIWRDQSDGGANTEVESKFEENLIKILFSNNKFKFISPLSLPQVKISYFRKLDKKTDFTINYSFNYVYNNNIQPIRLYGNGLLIGLRFNF